MTRSVSITILLAFFTVFHTLSQNIDPLRQWPSYRGYHSCGVMDHANLPEHWMEIQEKIYYGIQSSRTGTFFTVIWGDKLFITTAVSEKDEQGLKTGMLVMLYRWMTVQSMHGSFTVLIKYLVTWYGRGLHAEESQSQTPSQVVPCKYINCNRRWTCRCFFGSEGLYCYDMEGNLIWEKDFGVLKSVFFTMESAEWNLPVLPSSMLGQLLFNVMFLKFICGCLWSIDSKEIWKKERDEYPGWHTPNIYFDGINAVWLWMVINTGGGYDFTTGEKSGELSGGGDNSYTHTGYIRWSHLF